jgi:hypothetical protein
MVHDLTSIVGTDNGKELFTEVEARIVKLDGQLKKYEEMKRDASEKFSYFQLALSFLVTLFTSVTFALTMIPSTKANKSLKILGALSLMFSFPVWARIGDKAGRLLNDMEDIKIIRLKVAVYKTRLSTIFSDGAISEEEQVQLQETKSVIEEFLSGTTTVALLTRIFKDEELRAEISTSIGECKFILGGKRGPPPQPAVKALGDEEKGGK